MPENGCPHCGQVHPAHSRFCPETGQPLAVAAAAVASAAPVAWRSPGAPSRDRGGSERVHGPAPSTLPAADPASVDSVTALLAQAVRLYKENLGIIVLTCAVVLVPLAIVKEGALALILAPTMAVDGAAQRSGALAQETADEVRRDLAEAQSHPQGSPELRRQEQQRAEELARHWTTTEKAAVGGLLATLLGFVASLLAIALLYGAGIPLATAALTIVVADRIAGGDLRAPDAYRTLVNRLPKLLGATVPAFVLVLLGLSLLFIPGIVLAFLFAFVTPIVMLEDVGGTTALRRSISLVRANMSQVLAVGLVFAAIRLATSIVVSLFVPRGDFLLGNLVQDALQLVLLPLPIVGTVLLYLDVRRRADGALAFVSS